MSVVQDPAAPIAIPAEPDQARIARGERLKLLLGSPTFVIGCVLAGMWVLCALFGNQIAPHSPQAPDVLNKLAPPSSEHLFGTDRLGRDVVSRVIVGAKAVLVIAPLATLLGTILGTAIGLVTGYFRGFVDEVVMRLVDAILAVPVIIVALVAVVALPPGHETIKLILVIGFIFTPIIARIVRAAVLGEAQLEYVQAARLRNEHFPYVLFAEILPNVMGPVIVEFTVRLGYAIFAVATLSFLGFGADPSIPDWGLDISEHYAFINGGVWWAVLFPSLAIATLIVGINLIADAIASTFER
jgi:peptide/nickel transport system permease protein